MLNKKFIGRKVRQLRTDNDVRQDDLAASIGISKQMLSNIETGYRDATLDVSASLANYFNVSLDDIVGRKSRLFNAPDGTMEYNNIRDFDGNVLPGKFAYSFGAFSFGDLFIKFFYVEDVDGDFIARIQNAQGSLEFLAFVSMVNQTLKPDYEISPQKNGLHKVDFIVKVPSEYWANIFQYSKMYLNVYEGKVTVENIDWGGYQSFVREYLEWPTEKKIEFLSRDSNFGIVQQKVSPTLSWWDYVKKYF